MKTGPAAARGSLSVVDGVAMLVGIVIGVGIFKTPSLVAANTASEGAFIGLWLLGGLISAAGALCYAELGSARPSAGGEYHFLTEAYGAPVGLLFAWARCTVIQTGAIAAVAFVFADYANVLLPLGPWGSALHASAAIIVITAVNVLGTPQGRLTQVVFFVLTVAAVLAVIAAGFLAPGAPRAAADPEGAGFGAAGLAMVFILLTYGGWNETAYLSGEMRDVQRNLVRALMYGIGLVVALYLLVNLAYLNAFGLLGLRQSSAIGADLMRHVAGDWGAIALSVIVCCAALSTLNGTVFTGARAYYALGRDVAALGRLAVWDEGARAPVNALLTQGAISILLVAFGSVTRDGFEAMVAYTAPVFWLFMLAVAVSLYVFRWREPDRELPFRTPLFPATPAILAAACGWMLYSSLLYAGLGAIIGVLVLLAGSPLLLLSKRPGGSSGS